MLIDFMYATDCKEMFRYSVLLSDLEDRWGSERSWVFVCLVLRCTGNNYCLGFDVCLLSCFPSSIVIRNKRLIAQDNHQLRTIEKNHMLSQRRWCLEPRHIIIIIIIIIMMMMMMIRRRRRRRIVVILHVLFLLSSLLLLLSLLSSPSSIISYYYYCYCCVVVAAAAAAPPPATTMLLLLSLTVQAL